MGELTPEELRAIRRILMHFLDGGWREIIEHLQSDEESDALYDAAESAHDKLFRFSRRAAA